MVLMCLNNVAKQQIKSLAEYCLQYAVTHSGSKPAIDPADYSDELSKPGACFVTLEKNGELRGCIGSLEARQPLFRDVIDNTIAAAFSDPRFMPVQASELDDIKLSISILSKAEDMSIRDEDDLLNQLRSGVDGLILQEGLRRATFLPSVWQQLPQKRQFVEHLKRKAGLAEDYWSDTLRFWRYTSEYF